MLDSEVIGLRIYVQITEINLSIFKGTLRNADIPRRPR